MLVAPFYSPSGKPCLSHSEGPHGVRRMKAHLCCHTKNLDEGYDENYRRSDSIWKAISLSLTGCSNDGPETHAIIFVVPRARFRNLDKMT